MNQANHRSEKIIANYAFVKCDYYACKMDSLTR